MKSSIKIDYLDRGTGRGMEPIIRILLIKSDDPRDTLISYLFETLRERDMLQFHYAHHKPVSVDGYSDYEKTINIFKPEEDIEGKLKIITDIKNLISNQEEAKSVEYYLRPRLDMPFPE